MNVLKSCVENVLSLWWTNLCVPTRRRALERRWLFCWTKEKKCVFLDLWIFFAVSLPAVAKKIHGEEWCVAVSVSSWGSNVNNINVAKDTRQRSTAKRFHNRNYVTRHNRAFTTRFLRQKGPTIAQKVRFGGIPKPITVITVNVDRE